MATPGRDRGEWSHQFILDTIEKLDTRHLLRGFEVALVALFVLIVAFDAHRKAVQELPKTQTKTSLGNPALATSTPTMPNTSAQTGGARLAALAQTPRPNPQPTYRIQPINPTAPWNQMNPVVSKPAPDALTASPPAPTAARLDGNEREQPPPARAPTKPSDNSLLVAPPPVSKPAERTEDVTGALVPIPPAAMPDSAGHDRTTVAALPSKTEEPVKADALPAAPKSTEARREDKDSGSDTIQQTHDSIEAFRAAPPMFDRVLSPEEKAAAIDSDYRDAMQRIEGIYDPTRIGPFGTALRMMIRPGTMSMNNVFGDSWSRAFPDPNVHYRVGYHAETWLRPRSHNCDDFWRFRPNDGPVALEKLAPEDCKRIRSKAVSDTQIVSESSVVAAPLSVPVFAAPYPGGRMSHTELLAALRARIDAANEQLWYKRLTR